jgi:UDP-N-acetylmuramoyl-L-alanyl-D-glutamate--2,6-diaminopimelate ligase
MIKGLDVTSLKGLTLDSRSVKKGYLFAALAGAKTDGRKFIASAIQNGAKAILAETGTELPAGTKDIKLITDDNPRRALSLIAAAYYKRQPEMIAAVTGTNGKTSTVHFTKQLWKSAGLKAASIGTLGVRAPGMIRSGSMTTPDPVSLHAELADLAAAGVTHLAMEASSHGLHQYRLDGVRVSTAAFTNLTRDHLDYHKDMEEYFDSKLRLFTDIMQKGTAVLNADIPEFAALKKLCEKAGHKIISYGFKADDLKIASATPAPHGQEVSLQADGKTYKIMLPLVGGFQVMNALCALGLVLADDRKNTQAYIKELENLEGVPGRLQLVDGNANGAAVYIDYAHTPDALENILKSLRPHTTGKLVCVFGCGGDRDAGKRPVMGKIASDLADRIIITDDNPRSEDPAAIRAQILKGATGAQEISGRRAAIQQSIAALKPGDVLVIAGKGHEQGQIFADHTEHFDDYEEAEAAMQQMAKAGAA